MSIVVRRLASAELPALVELWRASGLPIKPGGRDRKDRLERELKDYPGDFIGAFDGPALVGAVLATWDGRKGWINRLAVHPSHRRQGIARMLIAAAERELDDRGALIIAALVETDNTPSRELFGRAGYEDYGEIVYVSKRKDPDA